MQILTATLLLTICHISWYNDDYKIVYVHIQGITKGGYMDHVMKRKKSTCSEFVFKERP